MGKGCLRFPVWADGQFKLSLFFVIKREYPQGVGDKTNSSVAFNRFFILPPKFTCKFLVPLLLWFLQENYEKIGL